MDEQIEKIQTKKLLESISTKLLKFCKCGSSLHKIFLISFPWLKQDTYNIENICRNNSQLRKCFGKLKTVENDLKEENVKLGISENF